MWLNIRTPLYQVSPPNRKKASLQTTWQPPKLFPGAGGQVDQVLVAKSKLKDEVSYLEKNSLSLYKVFGKYVYVGAVLNIAHVLFVIK